MQLTTVPHTVHTVILPPTIKVCVVQAQAFADSAMLNPANIILTFGKCFMNPPFKPRT